ncbi:MAG: DUF202 domain-containing protein [Aquificaceae bacterium]
MRIKSAKDARIYMSIERTYLGYIKTSVYTISLSVYFEKLKIFLPEGNAMNILIFLSITLGLFITIAGIIYFRKSIKRIDSGIDVEPREVTDPRIYMAAERTFLAWIRTSIALIIFGFVIERFEFFLVQLEKVFRINLPHEHKPLAKIGILVVFIGLLTLAFGFFNLLRAVKHVDSGKYRTNTFLYSIYGIIVFVSCLFLAFYLFRLT